METHEKIKDFPLFKEFGIENISKLRGLLEEAQFKSDEIILDEATPSSSLFIILSGRVKIFKKDKTSLNLLTILETGDVFGEVSFIDSMSRSASAAAVGPTEVAMLPFDNFQLLKHANPVFAVDFLVQLMKELTRKFRAVSGGVDIKSPDYTLAEIIAANQEIKVITASDSEFVGLIKFAERTGTAPLLKIVVKGQTILIPFHQVKAIVLPNQYGKF